MAKAVFGLARTETQAITIVNELKAAGFSQNDISVLFPDRSGTQDFAHEQHTKAPEGAAAGGHRGPVRRCVRLACGDRGLSHSGLGPLHCRGSHYGGPGGGPRPAPPSGV